MAYETLLTETSNNVLLIKLNRPEALNALNNQLLEELSDALPKSNRDDTVRAIVITGSEKAFAAGADIREMAQLNFVAASQNEVFGPIEGVLDNTRKPVIAAVSGFALGGGCELAMMCDFIIAADTAQFGQPEINLGIIPGLGGTQRLPRLVGKSKAMEMVLTGRFMDADEAERAGLVSRVVPAKYLLEDALKTAGKIASKSRLSVRFAKEAINRSYETSLNEGLHLERREFYSLFATEDQKEGMAAFLEKREAQFRDK